MSTPARLPIPLSLLLLDGVGALLFALGLAERVGGVPLLSQVIAVADIDLAALVLGAVLMAVAMAGIVRAALARGKALRRA